jgi:hypothetical protein
VAVETPGPLWFTAARIPPLRELCVWLIGRLTVPWPFAIALKEFVWLKVAVFGPNVPVPAFWF